MRRPDRASARRATRAYRAAALELRALVFTHPSLDVSALDRVRAMSTEAVRALCTEIRAGIERFNDENSSDNESNGPLRRVSLWDLLDLLNGRHAPPGAFVPRRPVGTPDCGPRLPIRHRAMEVLVRHPLSAFGLVDAPGADGVWAARAPRVFEGVMLTDGRRRGGGAGGAADYLLNFLVCVGDARAMALVRAAFPAETAGMGWPEVRGFLGIDESDEDLDDEDDYACFYMQPALPAPLALALMAVAA